MEERKMTKEEVRHIVKNITPYHLEGCKKGIEMKDRNIKKYMWYVLGCAALTISSAHLSLHDPSMIRNYMEGIATGIGTLGIMGNFQSMLNNMAQKANFKNILTEYNNNNELTNKTEDSKGRSL